MTQAEPGPTPAATGPSVAELQTEIAAARDDLVASLADLRAATTPGALARRGGRSVTGWFTDEFGGVRPERIAIVVGVVVGVVVLRRLVRRR